MMNEFDNNFQMYLLFHGNDDIIWLKTEKAFKIVPSEMAKKGFFFFFFFSFDQ